MTKGYPPAQGLYDPRFDHDSCGVGFITHIKGKDFHSIVDQSLKMLENMEHRGACGCEPDSGDGAGIMCRMPDKFIRREAKKVGIELPQLGQYGVGMVFLPKDVAARKLCEQTMEKIAVDFGMVVFGWRDVPVNSKACGPSPRKVEPMIRQIFVGTGESFYNRQDFDRRLYLVRQRTENTIESGNFPPQSAEDFYICCLSANRIIYKGMLTAAQVRLYFPDLSDPDFLSSLAIVHSRFSTNTFPSWRLAHPYRYLAHNGEINTLYGNRNWMRARYGSLQSEVFGDELQKMFPILTESGSDSATLDNALQFLCVNGRSLPHAVLMLIPEAWLNHDQMDEDLKAFYEYHACLMEPWDGPASIAFTNGALVGAVLDRNGLRPSRYYVTKDDLVIMASEVGVLPIPPESVARKWRLQPGKIFLIDSKQGRIIDDSEIKRQLVNKRPWKRWLEENLIELDSLPTPSKVHQPDHATLMVRQHAFGYTNEDLKLIMMPVAASGTEAVGSMGTDTPLACLSEKPQLLYNYFKQLFAQVTNPPLDAMREELVTSVYTYIGREGNLLDEAPDAAHLIKLKSPIINNDDLEKLREVAVGKLRAVTLEMLFKVSEGETGLQRALEELMERAARAVKEGASVLILSDRGVDAGNAPIPSLLATAAVHHHLIREGTRTQCGLVIETGEAREAHHFCLLIGYGAGAVNPYLSFETLADLDKNGFLPKDLNLENAQYNYIKAANKAILKVASKMGISTVQSYRGAQIFEAIGLGKEMIDRYFTGTASRIKGVKLEIIARESLERHRRGFPPIQVNGQVLDTGGLYQWRRDGEYHMWNPETVAKLQDSVRVGVEKPIDGYKKFKEYTALLDDEARSRCTLRGLLNFKKTVNPIPLEEVEPAKEIVKRFVTGAMSLGSISTEAHENLAIAMNRIGGKSNTGEGGEDSRRFQPDPQPDANGNVIFRRSAIKQVASARFGVTAEYLANADELQIKMAQGAKPGEGGQLPGHKVDAYIGKIRHSTPGVGLISPPPHHDIYSIEDLAQLIHDLKNSNPKARVSVKLVSEVGVGTIAAGVAKAKADHILISGDSGGTGAAPLTSIKYAGIPWELGLAETQQVLVMNNLRGRVIVQTDGQLKTGRDVVIAALLGAEEFGFSTGPLIASGCIMMRVCHLNTCPVGVATQDPELRKKFAGKPEHVINFFFFIAEEVRQYMAEMGFRKFEDMVGQTQLLEFMDVSSHYKARNLDLSVILHKPQIGADVAVRCVQKQEHRLEQALDNQLIKLAARAIERGEKVTANLEIQNVNRTVGTMLSNQIVLKYGHNGLPDDTITFKFTGSAGQSFGCFLARGITLMLEGDSNDYLGKGLSGGKIAIFPPEKATFKPEENIIAGNVICYGAIAGEVYIRGVVGERFCVRNSGVHAVVEGVGDHGCEYMTGGRVVVIGPTGRNFAAGMSGGIAYVYDDNGQFLRLCNTEMVELEKPDKDYDRETIKILLENHHKLTGSTRAKTILDDLEKELRRFVKVMPTGYRNALETMSEIEEAARKLGERQAGTV
ncbi:glutamate synthase large subunit [Nitrosomonas mobilis]|uniref:Glutamate synthase [NADPH] large chain n=1 Tax=Nitrosomonas mobilis TaxID=51642 RepID=A0A1G5SAD9_9PROT|nr:glutamate synthase large subunit [Nitrosomonas mobilis]SCZ84142.1 glutamate synthase, large subunit [Nitrosomonas mobilis]